MNLLAACFVFLLHCTSLVTSMPAWGIPSQGSISSLVSGNSFIVAKSSYREAITRYLTPSHAPGQSGNLTVLENPPNPPLFYVYRNKLWHFVNETAIYNINVINTTSVAHPTGEVPLQLVIGSKDSGIKHGNWRWRGTMLHYDVGGATNGGVYYSCQSRNGGSRLLMFLKGVPTPDGCSFITLHSFTRETEIHS